MTGLTERFFDAWGETDDAERGATIDEVFAKSGRYADPRSQGMLDGPENVGRYVAMFSANAPGWTAKVIKSDEVAGVLRVTVAFGGKGPDGAEMVQHGQYFVEDDGEHITRMIGFVGTGEP
ncbi:MAG: nuclear transport factor 2 family protein [Pseudomonadota bacterium]